MNIIIGYLIIGIIRALIMWLFTRPEYLKLGYDAFDTATGERPDEKNAELASEILSSYKVAIGHVLLWPICVIIDVVIIVIMLRIYKLNKRD